MNRRVVTYREFCDPGLCGTTIAGYEVPSLEDFPSMRDSVVAWDPDVKKVVLAYLRDEKFFCAASTSAYKRDVFTGEVIECSGDLYRDESGYGWEDYLAYYVDVYDVGLPDDFVAHVMSARAS